MNEFCLVVHPGEMMELLTRQNEGKGTEHWRGGLQTHSPAADTFIFSWLTSDILQ